MTRIGSFSERGAPFVVVVDGAPVPAYPGETIAGVLLAAGWRAWRTTRRGQPRGVFCGIGLCFDCLVTVDGIPNVRACMTQVTQGMVVETGHTPEVTV